MVIQASNNVNVMWVYGKIKLHLQNYFIVLKDSVMFCFYRKSCNQHQTHWILIIYKCMFSKKLNTLHLGLLHKKINKLLQCIFYEKCSGKSLLEIDTMYLSWVFAERLWNFNGIQQPACKTRTTVVVIRRHFMYA